MTMRLRNSLVALSLSTALISSAAACFAQNGDAQSGAPSSNSGPALGNPGGQDSIAQRIQRQRRRIKRALKMGSITDDQAQKLLKGVTEIEGQTQQLRAQNGGTLKPEDLKQIDNSLNQSWHEIISVAGAGKRPVQSGDVLGPKWKPGLDGAQKSDALIKEMRRENRRELRQERQSNAQKLEQQQLQYEKEMVDKLGAQREDILKQKDELKDVRKESGAD